MPRSRPPYPPEFRAQIIVLARAGRSVPDLAREFEPTEQTIYVWLKQADRDDGKHAEGLSSAERDELRRLRKENRQLCQEREIGDTRSPEAKAAAWFARETDTLPSRS